MKNKRVKRNKKYKIFERYDFNAETIAALNEYEAMRENRNGEYKRYNTFADVVKDILGDEHMPNDETIQAIEDVENGRNLSKQYTSTNELIKDLKK